MRHHPTRSREGICYAVRDDGVRVPVIDVTHPAFAAVFSERELAESAAGTLKHLRARRPPAFVMRWMARRSVIVRDLARASGGVLGGMATYLEKLGPENAAPWASALDRHLLDAIGPMCMRIRVREVAQHLAAQLLPMLERSPVASLRLLNIAGGTAIDSLNALIVLRKMQPGVLDGRRVVIRVLDPDREGPAFGLRALAALRADGRSLAGLDVSLEHVEYDWSSPGELAHVAGHVDDPGAVSVCSSEGGLLEYGSDEEVAGNLAALRDLRPPVRALVASLIRDGDLARAMQSSSGMLFRARDSASVRELLRGTGWSLANCVDCGPLYQVVTLRPM